MSEAVTLPGVALGPVIVLAVVGLAVAQGVAAACAATQRFVWSALGTAAEVLNEKLDAADGSLHGRSTGRRMRRAQPAVSFQTARTVLKDGDALERAARAAGLTVLRDVALAQEGGESVPLEMCVLEGEEVRFALRKGRSKGLEALWVEGDTQARSTLGRLVQRYQALQAVAAARHEGFEVVEKPRVTPRGDLEFRLRRRDQATDTTLSVILEAGGRAQVESASRQRATGQPGDCVDLPPSLKELGVPVPMTERAARLINLRRRGARVSTRGTPVERRVIETARRRGEQSR